MVVVVELNILCALSVSEPIQSDNMKDTYAFFMRNHQGTHTVISDSKRRCREFVCVSRDEDGWGRARVSVDLPLCS